MTLWLMFGLHLVAREFGLSRLTARLALVLLVAELVLLLSWSYGTDTCDGAECSPFTRAAGVAARVDLPILAAVLLTAATAEYLRRSRLS